MASVIVYAVGAAVLVLGRKLFWLFVAAVGFIAGMTLAQSLLPDLPQPALLVVALAAGVLSAVLAMLLKRIAVGAAGFVAGGYLAMWAVAALNVNLGEWQALGWAVFIAGGIVGAVFVSAVFDLALIVLSSAAGAAMIARSLMADFSLERAAAAVAFLVLFAVGIAIQSSIMKRE